MLKIINDQETRRVNIDLRKKDGPHVEITGKGECCVDEKHLPALRPFIDAFDLKMEMVSDDEAPKKTTARKKVVAKQSEEPPSVSQAAPTPEPAPEPAPEPTDEKSAPKKTTRRRVRTTAPKE